MSNTYFCALIVINFLTNVFANGSSNGFQQKAPSTFNLDIKLSENGTWHINKDVNYFNRQTEFLEKYNSTEAEFIYEVFIHGSYVFKVTGSNTFVLKKRRIPIPADYIYIKNFGYYKHHQVTATWLNARTICENENAHLAVFDSQHEVDMLRERFNISSLTHIGVHELFAEGLYVTVTDKLLSKTGFTKWCHGEPHNGPGESCVDIRANGCLDDVNCDRSSHPFLCKIDL